MSTIRKKLNPEAIGQLKRAEMVRELELTKNYQRTHTPTGVQRRLPDPPEPVPPDMDKTGTRRRLSNLKPPKGKGPN